MFKLSLEWALPLAGVSMRRVIIAKSNNAVPKFLIRGALVEPPSWFPDVPVVRIQGR
jgi:hypothetical protein